MKMKIFSFLPKSATVTFQQNHPPFSPGRENHNKHKSHVNKGFSGQLIPDEARRKSSSGKSFGEPTSPKVSCMGQIKLKKKVCNSSKSASKEEQDHQQKKSKKRVKNNKDSIPSKSTSSKVVVNTKAAVSTEEENNKKFDAFVSSKKPSLANTKAAPSLDQMKRFASGRDSLANFDWRDFHDDGEDGQEEEDEVFIAHSAPLMMGGGGKVAMEPKKEINLWKRRTTTPPKPLQINVTNNKDK